MTSALIDSEEVTNRIDYESIRLVMTDEATSGEIETEWSNKIGYGELDAIALIWFGPNELVQPLSYKKYSKLDEAKAFAAMHGFSTRFRQSGGGLVPQGDGILNLSLIWKTKSNVAEISSDVYRHLGSIIKKTFSKFQVETFYQEVPGAFCDGRFNLATMHQGQVKKLVGTAQYWKKYNETYVVLAHAVILMNINNIELCDLLNKYEEKLGSDKCYSSDAIVDFCTLYNLENEDFISKKLIKELFIKELTNQIIKTGEN
uniref:lipoyl protein ligase domain-containing protein n=1 Tax=Polynucleobacter sp. TaxID=2029855 RepID=UPI004048B20E